jgi:osmoprotectant transport system permease protein
MDSLAAWLSDPTNWSGSDGIPTRIIEHLVICGQAMFAALVIALPIGLFIGHSGRGATAAINVANIGRAIPSYALLGMLLPLTLALDPVNGLFVYPTFLAMVVLAIPPILVGAYAGIRTVDRDLIEAARGMGLRERQILFGVELPLAIPVVMGGIRTATLQVIATATIGAIVGGPGIGRYIKDGLNNQQPAKVIVGAILVALVAIVADLLLAVLQRALTPRPLRAGNARLEPPEVPGEPPPVGARRLVHETE